MITLPPPVQEQKCSLFFGLLNKKEKLVHVTEIYAVHLPKLMHDVSSL